MKGLFYYLKRCADKAGEAARTYAAVHGNAGKLIRGGRLVIGKGASIVIREGGVLKTGTGTVTVQCGSRIIVENGGELIIGDDVGINSNCYIAVHNKITIGNNTIFGPGVTLVDQDHDYRAQGGLKAEQYKVGTVDIGNNVWLGAGAVILRDSAVGDDAVVGAGSIVKGNVPKGSVYITGRA